MICFCVLYGVMCRDDVQLWIQKRHGHSAKSFARIIVNSKLVWTALRFAYTLTPLLFRFNNVHREGAFGGGNQAAGGTPSFGG